MTHSFFKKNERQISINYLLFTLLFNSPAVHLPRFYHLCLQSMSNRPTAHRLLGDTVKSIEVNAPDEMIAPFFIPI